MNVRQIGFFFSLTVAGIGLGATPLKPEPAPEPRLSSLPLSFEANQNQTNPTVRFLSRGAGYTLFLTSDSAVFNLHSSVVRMKLAGANSDARIFGGGTRRGTVNYFIGNDPKKWTSGASSYQKVNYEQIYKGIDLLYYGTERQLEYDFVVAPGADSRQITLEFGDAQASLDGDGSLALAVDGARLRFRRPVIYQTIRKACAICGGQVRPRARSGDRSSVDLFFLPGRQRRRLCW
jgi:hypothetical protein